MQLKTNPNSPSKKRLMPEESICTYPSVAPSPDGVSNVRVVLDEDKTSYKHENNQFELEMNVSWSQPDGLIAGYEVRLVESESLNAEDSPGEVFASQTVDVSIRILRVYSGTSDKGQDSLSRKDA